MHNKVGRQRWGYHNNLFPASATIAIGINPVPSVDAGNAISYCAGLSSNLSASGAVSYVWSPATGLSNPNIANPIVSTTSSQTYTVTGTSNLGCTATDQVLVTVNPLPLHVVAVVFAIEAFGLTVTVTMSVFVQPNVVPVTV